jgi:microsomal epoxide hydrolase
MDTGGQVGVTGGIGLAMATAASGGAVEVAESRSFITSDGVRLQDLETGPAGARHA